MHEQNLIENDTVEHLPSKNLSKRCALLLLIRNKVSAFTFFEFYHIIQIINAILACFNVTVGATVQAKRIVYSSLPLVIAQNKHE